MLVGAKLVRHGRRIIESSIALGSEASADVPEEVREHCVVRRIEDFEPEAGFEVVSWVSMGGGIYDL